MALIEEFDKVGNWLFKKRSYLPLVMYILAFLVIALDEEDSLLSPNNFTAGLLCLGVSLFGIFIRALVIGFVPKSTSGRNTHEQVAETVNTLGIYSVVRHPLYLGNFFMWLGIILYVGNLWFTIVSCLLYWLYYERIIFAEEYFMRSKFKEQYTDWAKNVPAFWPSFKNYKPAPTIFSVKNVLKREYSGFLAVFVSFFIIDFLKHYFEENQLILDKDWLLLLVGAAAVTLVLKVLKKKKFLEVEGR
ncbi:MAG: methyltransferase family protein [Luteibaculaceae bacterium]